MDLNSSDSQREYWKQYKPFWKPVWSNTRTVPLIFSFFQWLHCMFILCVKVFRVDGCICRVYFFCVLQHAIGRKKIICIAKILFMIEEVECLLLNVYFFKKNDKKLIVIWFISILNITYKFKVASWHRNTILVTKTLCCLTLSNYDNWGALESWIGSILPYAISDSCISLYLDYQVLKTEVEFLKISVKTCPGIFSSLFSMPKKYWYVLEPVQ